MLCSAFEYILGTSFFVPLKTSQCDPINYSNMSMVLSFLMRNENILLNKLITRNSIRHNFNSKPDN